MDYIKKLAPTLENVQKLLDNLVNYQTVLSPIKIDINRLYDSLPPIFQQAYALELFNIVKNINPELPLNAEHFKAIQALNFEKHKILSIANTDAVFSTHALKLKTKTEYLKYDKRAKVKTLVDVKPDIPEHMLIQNDVPIMQVVNGVELPYIYETKYYPSAKYGSRGKDLNQLLKYQKALDAGLIAGSTLDIQGRISQQFIDWMSKNKELIPDIRIVYTMQLPSGLYYHAVLKDSERIDIKHPEDVNQLDKYTVQDLAIIQGVEYAIENHMFNNIITTPLTEEDLPSAEHPGKTKLITPDEHGKKMINNPYDLTDVDSYIYFIEQMQSLLIRRFEELSYSCTTSPSSVF